MLLLFSLLAQHTIVPQGITLRPELLLRKMLTHNPPYLGFLRLSIFEKIRSQHHQHLLCIPICDIGILCEVPGHLIIPSGQDIIYGIRLAVLLQIAELDQLFRNSPVMLTLCPVPHLTQSQDIKHRQLAVIRKLLLDACLAKPSLFFPLF